MAAQNLTGRNHTRGGQLAQAEAGTGANRRYPEKNTHVEGLLKRRCRNAPTPDRPVPNGTRPTGSESRLRTEDTAKTPPEGGATNGEGSLYCTRPGCTLARSASEGCATSLLACVRASVGTSRKRTILNRERYNLVPSDLPPSHGRHRVARENPDVCLEGKDSDEPCPARQPEQLFFRASPKSHLYSNTPF